MQFSLWGRPPQFYDVAVLNVSSSVCDYMQQNCAEMALLQDDALQLPGRPAASQTPHLGGRAPK